jgi:uncharacterized membrane protein YtjA (UPF0391 family)
MSRWGLIILVGALGAGYFGLGALATGLGGVVPTLFAVFVAAFLLVLTWEAVAWRRRSV